jgi:ribonuclease HI
VQFKWLKGHAGITENERCDELAVEAGSGSSLQVDEGYELSIQ